MPLVPSHPSGTGEAARARDGLGRQAPETVLSHSGLGPPGAACSGGVPRSSRAACRPGRAGSQEIILSLEKLMNRSKIQTSCFLLRVGRFLAAPAGGSHEILKCHHDVLVHLVPAASSEDLPAHTYKGPVVRRVCTCITPQAASVLWA